MKQNILKIKFFATDLGLHYVFNGFNLKRNTMNIFCS